MEGPMPEVRKARTEEIPDVAHFYQDERYSAGLDPSDILVIARDQGCLVGVHRLCHEHGALVLRGMRVSQACRRQGVGSAMLRLATSLMENCPCYCIAHRYLTSFYAQRGFIEIDPDHAPEFLRRRLEGYRQDLGLDVVILRSDERSRAAPQRIDTR